MKTIRLSDEDYEALLSALSNAAQAHRVLDEEYGWHNANYHLGLAHENERLLKLLEPIEYEEA